jgi:ribosome-associated protein
MEKVGVFAKRTEGAREGRWVVIDYGDILVHLFNDESRLFYHLEQLWGDDKNTTRY